MSSTFSSTSTGISLSVAAQNPVTIVSGAIVTNTTTAHYGDALYGSPAAAWTIGNFGTLNATGAASSGLDLRSDGTVTNAASARITGVVNGIVVRGDAGTVNNAGTVSGTGTSGTAGRGIYLYTSSGFVSNASAGLIVGVLDAVKIGSTAASVINSGTISATGTAGEGVLLATVDGSVTNNLGGKIFGVKYGV